MLIGKYDEGCDVFMMKVKRYTFKKLAITAVSTFFALNLAACGVVEPERIVSYNDYKSYNDVKEVVRDADIIVVGRVKTVQPPQEWNINLDKSAEPVKEVYTLSDIEVLESVKGPAPGTTITIKQAGGLYEGKIYEESGAQFVESGKEYLFFLDSFDDRAPGEPYTLINPSQGMVEIKKDTIQPQGKDIYMKNGNSLDQILAELKSVSDSLPPRDPNVDQELIDQVKNQPD